ncbi:hypothetical protein A2755_03480 [Candidatus Wolfebacteria bacterium RIFCSPHIGHO2_01_FULL_48_22]|uniref:Uncharacterized protein n=2 Tax=Candidatus Wolfeibacteriota TaxID=1752735 RepID=A0A1F8DRJ8_9BACT|nr:MAG: hypothetical protein A2755_03480 [Candidatus Wolfebacteria bacterium RIFCSPHIGHO2_01_FULL_48_22]OGM92089.1 MAG: hypothetical protein A2935_01970 [Candidatus Wolfebacteria bacterium RIFCSPLOWO2_01_FULL_47_17b]
MKTIFIILFVLPIFSFGTVVYAQTTTISSSSLALDQIPGDPTNPQGPADLVQKIFAFAIYIAGTLAVIMIVYGGVRYVVEAGNTASQTEAKEVLKGAVWGIILLAGGWLILNTINPQLTNLSNLGLQNVTIHGNTSQLEPPEGQFDTGGNLGDNTLGCTVENIGMSYNDPNSGLQKIAIDYLATTPNLDSGGDCGVNTSPRNIVNAVAGGTIPQVCDRSDKNQSCSCEQGGDTNKKTLCPLLLQRLTILQQNASVLPSFTIESLTGGDHSPGSTHYQGRGVDITVPGGSIGDWQNVRAAMVQAGFRSAKFEYNRNGRPYFSPGSGNDGDFLASGSTNQHIHAESGGAGSPPPGSENQLLEDLKNLALQLDLNKFKGDMSWGLPSSTLDPTYTCNAGSDPRSIISETSKMNLPMVCDTSAYGTIPGTDNVFSVDCSCNVGGKDGVRVLDKRLLQKLVSLQESGIDYRVVSLTGGVHKNDGIASSHHYSGTALDVVPMSGSVISQNQSDWIALYNAVKSAQPIAGIVDYIYDEVNTDSKIVFEGVTPIEYRWIDSIITKPTNDTLALLQCPTMNFSGSSPTHLYSIFEIKNPIADSRFHTEIIGRCYNPRIRAVVN